MAYLARPPESSPASSLWWPLGPHAFCVWLDCSIDPVMHAGPRSATEYPMAACGAPLSTPLAVYRAGQFNLSHVTPWPPLPRWTLEFVLGPRPDQLIPPLLRCGSCYTRAGVPCA